MLVPGDPRFDEILRLSQLALEPGLTDAQRDRWRELCGLMLGALKLSDRNIPERRRALRAASQLVVEVRSQGPLAGRHATSSVSAGGIAMKVRSPPPLGTQVDLAIRVTERPEPLVTRGQVVWARRGEVGLVFTDMDQTGRELLEATAVNSLLVYLAIERAETPPPAP